MKGVFIKKFRSKKTKHNEYVLKIEKKKNGQSHDTLNIAPRLPCGLPTTRRSERRPSPRDTQNIAADKYFWRDTHFIAQ